MPPQNTQNTAQPQGQMDNQSEELSPDEAAASLSFATHLSQKLLGGQASPEATPPDNPETAPKETTDTTAIEEQFADEIKSLRKEMKTLIKKELADIRQDIKDALTDDQTE